MQLETNFLRFRTPVTVGSYFGEWRVTWAGGWTKDRLSYLVMVARRELNPSISANVTSRKSAAVRSCA
jgi:hypothetical protein